MGVAMRLKLAVLSLAFLGACDQLRPIEQSIAEFDLIADTERAFATEFLAQPFADGMVYAVAEEHGEIHTYALTPCRGNTRVCGDRGHVGQLTRTPDYTVITGAYPGRTFYLSPGGDGWLKWRGAWHPLAWD